MGPLATLPNWSVAVTVTSLARPAVTVFGSPLSVMLAAAAASTVTKVPPVTLATMLSVAVMVCTPALFSVTLPSGKTPWSSWVKVWLAKANEAVVSEDPKFAVPR